MTAERSRRPSQTGHPRSEPGSRTPLQQIPLQSSFRHPLRDISRESPPAQPVPIAVPGPVDQEGLALDLVLADEPPVTAVLRVVAVVAHDDVGVGLVYSRLAAVRVVAVVRAAGGDG